MQPYPGVGKSTEPRYVNIPVTHKQDTRSILHCQRYLYSFMSLFVHPGPFVTLFMFIWQKSKAVLKYLSTLFLFLLHFTFINVSSVLDYM